MNDRRLMKIKISLDILTVLFTEKKRWKIVKGLPEDSVFITNWFNPGTGISYLIFYHQSFDPLSKDAEIPELQIVFESV